MSLNLIMNTAQSGLMTAQQQLRIVSDNVSNVNTPGYIRKIGDQQSLSTFGSGSGVEVARVRLATDRFLQAASMGASGEAARQGVRAELFDLIQSQFGDPGSDTGFFSQIDSLFSAFGTAAENVTSASTRQDAVYRAQQLFDEAARISAKIQSTRQEADGRIKSAVDTANSLLEQIEGLNLEISRAAAVGADSSGPETRQQALISQLSEIMDVQVQVRPIGGVSIRTRDGVMLAGQGVAKIEYAPAGTVSAETAFNDIWVTQPGGQKRSLLESITTGQIRGLVELRDNDAPQAAERLAELVSHVADELNRAHNANTSVPAPQTLTGRNVGMSLDTALTGFTGVTNVAIVDSTGVVQNSARIVFSGGAMTINGVATTPASFMTTLSGQLGGASVSFTNGQLQISAGAAQGVSIADDPTTPSNKAGRGFSHFFGLNDLVVSSNPAIYDTGLTMGSAHGFTAGETFSMRFTAPSGTRLRDIEVAVPAGGTVGDLIAALNDPVTGVGRFGSFALGADGALAFTASATPAPIVSVLDDHTTQVPSGLSISELFGLGGARASRADSFSIRTDIQQNGSRLALAQLNLGAPAGTSALSAGDNRGATLLAEAGQRNASFLAAGGATAANVSVSRYAAELSGELGGKAAAAKNRADAAQALSEEATARRTSQEGVNLDEELVLMTTYQQAFNASARMIQAAADMYDTLLGMVR